MILTLDDKARLVARFEPLLYLPLDEPDFPVQPRAYAERCALWSSAPPTHARTDWGMPSGANRAPLVARGALTGPTAPPAGHETWLDHGGWHDGPDVTPSSGNRRAAGALGARLPQPWYSADVWTMDEVSAALGSDGLRTRFGFSSGDVVPAFERLVVVAYHFLFPVHTRQRSNTAHPPETDPFASSYDGDWCSFAVIARGSADGAGRLRVDAVSPEFGAYGQRFRPASPDHDGHIYERMQLQPWTNVLTSAEHPVVIATGGTHNLYPHDTPVNTQGQVEIQWIGEGLRVSEPANAFVRDSTEEPYSVVFALKVLLGFLLGGPIGAAIGGAAAGAEAAEAEDAGLYEAPKLEADPPPENDDPLVDDWTDLERDKIGKPAHVASAPLADAAQSDVRNWACTPLEALTDGHAWLASGSPGHERIGFNGRWGVRCDLDPFARRAGDRFSLRREVILDALLARAAGS